MNSENNPPVYTSSATVGNTPIANPMPEISRNPQADDGVIQLLEERLLVDRSKRKVGDVIVRKEVETRMVQVPVRRERLIVEQLTPERRQLARIDLSQGEVTGVELVTPSADSDLDSTNSTIRASFASAEAASRALAELAKSLQGQNEQIEVEVFLKGTALPEMSQIWLDQHNSS